MTYNTSHITEELHTAEICLTNKETGKTITFWQNMVRAGRSTECDLAIDKEHRYVARIQAIFFYENGKWYVQDNHSTNGTYLNGVRCNAEERYVLGFGDEIDFAHSVILVYEQFIKETKALHEEDKLLTNSVELKSLIKEETDSLKWNFAGNSKGEQKERLEDWNRFIGKIIAGRYEFIKKCDSFQNVVTFIAQDMRLSKQWRIKVCKLKGDSHAVIGQALVKEAHMLRQLAHPGIPRVLDFIQDEDYLYIVEDYLEGRLLEEVVREDGPQSPELVVDWAKQVCEILSYLHNRQPAIIHRDIKPHNLLLTLQGKVMLIDFDLMLEYDPKKNADTCWFGTKGYAPPEQYGTMGQTDARTDIFALGATMHRLVTGANPCEPPYELFPIRYYNPQLPVGLEKIIVKCMNLNPLERYQNDEELMAALEDWDKPEKKAGFIGKLFGKKK